LVPSWWCSRNRGYEVEFVNEDGETRALATLRPKQISATAPTAVT
jgi:hypothetical protein